MIFRPRQKTLLVTRQIVLENNVLEQVDNTKFLGVYIDKHLDWKTHVNFIAAKISKSVGLLYKAKYYLLRNVIDNVTKQKSKQTNESTEQRINKKSANTEKKNAV